MNRKERTALLNEASDRIDEALERDVRAGLNYLDTAQPEVIGFRQKAGTVTPLNAESAHLQNVVLGNTGGAFGQILGEICYRAGFQGKYDCVLGDELKPKRDETPLSKLRDAFRPSDQAGPKILMMMRHHDTLS